jgi:hypothetical protein
MYSQFLALCIFEIHYLALGKYAMCILRTSGLAHWVKRPATG